MEYFCPCLGDCFGAPKVQGTARAAALAAPLVPPPAQGFRVSPPRDRAPSPRRPRAAPVGFPAYPAYPVYPVYPVTGYPSAVAPPALAPTVRRLPRTQTPAKPGPMFPTPVPLAPVGTRRKALLIGISYRGTPLQLKGCIWDLHRVQRQLLRLGFAAAPGAMLVLSDEAADARLQPTKRNIERAMQWLVADASAGDSLFLYFSGHGSQVPDLEGDEEDMLDETIVPCDWRDAGQITDDEIYRLMVTRLPQGARLTCLLDCCHSGSLLDLPYSFVPPQLPHAAPSSHTTRGRMGGRPGSVPLWGDVVVFSGCTDEQESADVSNIGLLFPSSGNTPGGAMTNAFLHTLERNPRSTLLDLIQSCALLLRARTQQLPVMSASKPFDLHQPFTV